MKKFISGIIVGTVLATSVSVFAATIKTINASYSVNKLIVNGVDTGKGNTAFISQGTTYVPLRTVSDALGQDIKWDSSTKSIYINSKSNSPVLEEPTDIPSISNPTTNTTTGGTWNGQKLITMATAESAAIKAVGGGTVIVRKADIYEYDELPTYDFKISKNGIIYEVEINALNGVVVDYDID
ncbi:MAG: hypothetical protein K2L15_01220 [Eubacteriales bacterium]|nr:hypothetical protein [Eubacteriales bacterium]